MKYSLGWAQLRQLQAPEAYDWQFVLEESFKLALISLTAWWVIT